MPTTRHPGRRAATALSMVLTLLAAMFTIGLAPAQAANKGTLKVYQTEQRCQQNANDPKIYSPYWMGGTDFAPNAAFTLTINTQPGGQTVETLTGTTDANGSFCAGPVTTEAGMYKAEMTGPAGDKSKVYDVEGIAPTEVTPTAPPQPTAPECDADGVFNPPAPQDGVIWTVDPDTTTGPGQYTVTATPAEGYTFPEGTQTTWTITVNPATGDCPTPPTEVTPTAAPAPTFTEPTCEGQAADVAFTDTAEYRYRVDGTVEPGGTVTVTATATEGHALTGTTVWEYTFATIASLDCEVVGELEDETTDDGVVSGTEDAQLAHTGADTGPAGLGVLLVLAGAVLVGARRFAIR
jgi:hypothetical protein